MRLMLPLLCTILAFTFFSSVTSQEIHHPLVKRSIFGDIFGKIKEHVEDAGKAAVDIGKTVVDAGKNIVQNVQNGGDIGQTLEDAGKNLGQTFVKTGENLGQSLINTSGNIVHTLVKTGQNLKEGGDVGETLLDASKNIGQSLLKTGEDVDQTLSDISDSIGHTLLNTTGDIGHTLLQNTGEVGKTFQKGINIGQTLLNSRQKFSQTLLTGGKNAVLTLINSAGNGSLNFEETAKNVGQSFLTTGDKIGQTLENTGIKVGQILKNSDKDGGQTIEDSSKNVRKLKKNMKRVGQDNEKTDSLLDRIIPTDKNHTNTIWKMNVVDSKVDKKFGHKSFRLMGEKIKRMIEKLQPNVQSTKQALRLMTSEESKSKISLKNDFKTIYDIINENGVNVLRTKGTLIGHFTTKTGKDVGDLVRIEGRQIQYFLIIEGRRFVQVSSHIFLAAKQSFEAMDKDVNFGDLVSKLVNLIDSTTDVSACIDIARKAATLLPTVGWEGATPRKSAWTYLCRTALHLIESAAHAK